MTESASQIYEDLIGGPHPLGDEFDIHIAASVLALSLTEAKAKGKTLGQTLGLDGADLARLADAFFPQAKPWLMEQAGESPVVWAADEEYLRDLLGRLSTAQSGFQQVLAAIITRRAQSPNHLWQDLGLRDRTDLSRLMERHFAPLKDRNSHDMKWKKFLYRTICRDEGYGFCTSPTCAECDDYAVCFGDEAGESLLPSHSGPLSLNGERTRGGEVEMRISSP